MRLVHSAMTALAVAASVATLGPAATAETAKPDQVVAFSHEFTELKVWESPKGCQVLPPGTHLVFNQTPNVITIYADPLCLIPIDPFSRVKPGYGSHVSAVGSFKA